MAIAILLAAATFCRAEVKEVRILTNGIGSALVRDAVAAFAARIERRCPARIVAGKAELTIRLRRETGIGPEGFFIREPKSGEIEIAGPDDRGLLYGLGKLLHTSSFTGQGFAPGSWRGKSVPISPVRGIYLA